MLSWTPALIAQLLRHPEAALAANQALLVLIQHRGGLAAFFSQLLTLPLRSNSRLLLERLVSDPRASMLRHADELHVSPPKLYAIRRGLLDELSVYLNDPWRGFGPPPEGGAGGSAA
ncbi:MAG TPA: hypothetical protein VGE07_01980 [Herpetosiphonaceae bacterium]